MTTTIVCKQSDIFHQSFSLRVNKFISSTLEVYSVLQDHRVKANF